MVLKLMKNIFLKLKKNFKDISISKTYSGEGIIINNDTSERYNF